MGARNVMKKSAAVLSVAVLMMLGTEIYVRWAMSQDALTYTPGMLEKVPPLRYRLTPGFRGEISWPGRYRASVAVNSLGLRGPEVLPKQPGDFRVLALGDSFTFGIGVEVADTYVARLTKLAPPNGPRVVTLNGGVPGYGVPDALAFLEEYGLALEPDLVLVSILLGNDILDATERGRVDWADGLPAAGANRGLVLWLFRHSHFFRWALRANLGRLVGLPDSWQVSYVRDMLVTTSDDSSPLTQEGRENSRQALAALAALSKHHGFRLGVVLIPTKLQLDPESARRLFEWLDVDPTTFDAEATDRFFTTVLRDYGIPFLNLRSTLKQETDTGDPLFIPDDGHFTPRGHEVAAGAICNFLVTERLLESPSELE